MKNNSILNTFTVFAILCLLMSSCSQGPVDVTGEIAAANQSLMAVFESGDAGALKAFYTADAKLFPENSVAVEGPEPDG